MRRIAINNNGTIPLTDFKRLVDKFEKEEKRLRKENKEYREENIRLNKINEEYSQKIKGLQKELNAYEKLYEDESETTDKLISIIKTFSSLF